MEFASLFARARTGMARYGERMRRAKQRRRPTRATERSEKADGKSSFPAPLIFVLATWSQDKWLKAPPAIRSGRRRSDESR